MYHRIAEESFDPWGLAVTPDRFEQQLAWIAANRSPFSLTDFAARHRDSALPANAVAVTFDDGYACFAEVAAPLLEQSGIPATVFIPAELVERGGPFWWDELQAIVLDHADDHIKFDGVSFPFGAKDPLDAHWQPGAAARTARQKGFQQIWSALRERPPAALDQAMGELRAQCPDAAQNTPAVMSAEQARDTASVHIDIGSHALTHPWLASLSSSEKAREIGESVERCASLAGSRPTTFAYPYGNFDAESAALAKAAGFTCACATIPTSVRRDSGLFALPRIQVGNWDAGELARRLARTP